MKPIIAITVGDFNGIGPEIALKAATHAGIKKICTPLLVGPLSVFEHTQKSLKIKATLEKVVFPWKKTSVPVLDIGDGIWADVQFGKVTKASGRNAGLAIEKAVELCKTGRANAMVTAPVSKEALNLAGYNFPGQTEMIALLSRSQRVAMMLVSDQMRIGLVTIHTALRNAADNITKEKIIEKVSIVNDALKYNYLIESPRIAVLALNPHAGEKGLIGKEEQEIIIPALNELKNVGVTVDGPFSADAFFGTQSYKAYDAIVAMYHDQGLIPLKMSSFGKGVNFSAGLNMIRTSPDHGTAYDIAGKGKATISSMVEAIKLAVKFCSNAIKPND
ncbi:MAG: 4-hydroxythreonine-4-phosphate dehydrogenase PdxA [Ignavibacteriales bacterium]|nr:4-hydroxythreonine-4-phosphate dehydrogenase PdxA [Ignavibacteriales bacterium]